MGEVEAFPGHVERDPRTDPREGDVLSDGRFERAFVRLEGETVRYASAVANWGRWEEIGSRRTMPAARWMEWAAKAEVLYRHEERCRVHRLQRWGVVRVTGGHRDYTLVATWGSVEASRCTCGQGRCYGASLIVDAYGIRRQLRHVPNGEGHAAQVGRYFAAGVEAALSLDASERAAMRAAWEQANANVVELSDAP